MNPIFIGGCGRSGTTLAVDLIGMHPQLSPIYETGFVIDLVAYLLRDTGLSPFMVADEIRGYMQRWSRDLPFRPHEKRDYERYWHGAHHVLFTRDFAMGRTEALIDSFLATDAETGFRRFIRELFAEHARLDGKPGWANKTPRYVLMLPVLQRLFPDMVFVHCLRDPRPVAASLLSRSWGPKTAADAARFWLDCVDRAEAFARTAPDRYVELRYEDLTEDPQGALSRALGRLGIEDRAGDMIARYRERIEIRPPAGEDALDPALIETVEAAAGPAMARLGYR
ncbi:MAG: sulfotransferase [Hyphomicrobium sp.]|uniref:sulfotransferase family protein n=1 Tax=Hyphomicrobium sp. TaxID=82 RepID=UPI003D0D3320